MFIDKNFNDLVLYSYGQRMFGIYGGQYGQGSTEKLPCGPLRCHPHFRFRSRGFRLRTQSQFMNRSEKGCRWHPEGTTRQARNGHSPGTAGKTGKQLNRNEEIVQSALSGPTILIHHFVSLSRMSP